MNKFITITFLFFCFSQNDFGQNIYVEYDAIFNTFSPRKTKAYLKITKDTTYYVESSDFKLLNAKNDNETIVNSSHNSTPVTTRVLIDHKNQKLKSIERMMYASSIFNVVESVPIIHWDISVKENKKIGKFNCFKAIGSFRGRNYTIWYAPEIPSKARPWKLNGAPGVILEAYDESNTYLWRATKISDHIKKTDELIHLVKFDREMDLRSFVDIKYNQLEERKLTVKNRILSKMPRGTILKMNSSSIRKGRELIFEWEEQKK